MVNIKNYYKLYWENGGYSAQVEPFCLYKRKYIENCIRANSKAILDAGCGDGEFSLVLQKDNNVVFGLDISETAVNAAKSRNIHAQAHDIDESFPFEDKFFDIVLLFDIDHKLHVFTCKN
jgi:2-polyprenyl-3-methyl-5-hydroxy-6-metoxy-1,4-benzoquinol methylase